MRAGIVHRGFGEHGQARMVANYLVVHVQPPTVEVLLEPAYQRVPRATRSGIDSALH